jgi:peptidoglycan/LPS O-acetylase OafA/YrhL
MNQANPAIRETLSGVQALRAMAAAAVAVAHTGSEFDGHLALPGLLPNLVYGAAGVDLFFVISGFVMVYASERLFGRDGAFRAFMIRRIIRIVPLYWAMTTVMLLYVWARGFTPSDASPALAFWSYLFIPYPRPSGAVNPLYALGWTLNYEMMFYLAFGCALFARRHIAVLIVSSVLLAFAIAHALVSRLPDQIAFWTNPIILEFVFGMALALLYRCGVRLPQPMAYLLAAAALAIFFGTLTSNPQPRWLVWGVPAAMLVASVTLANRSAFVPATVIALGDASYALYLTHPAVNVITRHAAWKGAYIPPATAPWLYLIATVLLSILVAFAVHYWAERPVSEYLKRKLATPQQRQVAPGLDSGM